MAHILVEQLRFARSELMRGLEGISAADACSRLYPMNCISWIVGHLANQEHTYWVRVAQHKDLYPELNALVGYGKPASTPALDEMMAIWAAVTRAADVFLDTLTPEKLQGFMERNGKPVDESTGTLLLRNIYHYWYHIGEAMAIRQQLGHTSLPEYVGEMNRAPYHPEG